MTARGKEAAARLCRTDFGSAPMRDSIAAIAGDPRGALFSDIERPAAGYLAASLPSGSKAAREVSDFRAEEQAKKKLAQRAQKLADGATPLAQNETANQMRPPQSQPPLP